MEKFNKLSRAEMRNVTGGDFPQPVNCVGSLFYTGTDGCGTITCWGYINDGSGDCDCDKEITMPYPCGWA